MIKSDNKKIEVYSKFDKKEMETSIKLCIAGEILMFILFITNINIITIFLMCITSLMLLISIVIYKKTSEEPKLRVVLTKDYIEVFEKKGTFRCNMDKINSFSCDYSRNSLNEVFINYYDEKNKKVSKMFFLKGMNSREFINIANGVLNCKEDIEYSEILSNNNNIEDIEEETKWGNVAKILCYVGNQKLVTIINNKKNVDKFENILCFIDKNGKEFKIYWDDIILEKDLRLNVNNFYAVKYDENKEVYNIFYTDFKFDINIVDKYKNKLDVKTTLICNDEIIKEEIRVLDKYRKLRESCKYALLISILLLSILITIKNEWYGFIVFKIFPILIFSILVIFFIITLYLIKRIKGIE